MLTRRTALQMLGVTGVAVATGSALLPSADAGPVGTTMADVPGMNGMAGMSGMADMSGTPATGGPTVPAPPAATIPKFTTPLPLPRVKQPFLRTASTDYYASTITASTAQLVPGHATAVVTYDGAFDTEYIRARSGRRVVVLQGNSTATPASVHLHGGHNPTSSDGAPMDTIAQGQRKTYVYENDQPAATLWRHDHAHHHESESVYRGQASTYVVTSPEEDRLNLPSGRFEVPLVLRDAHLDGSGQLVYVMDDAPGRSTILVNGAPWPVMAVAARRYRFRVVNASNMRFFALGFTDGTPVTQIGVDGGLLATPNTTPVIVLSPGERADVVVDFTGRSGAQLVWNNYIDVPGTPEDVGVVMRFDVGDPAPDTSTVPATLSALAPLVPPTVQRSFTLKMDETASPMVGTINGLAYDMDRVDTTVRFGATEEWTVTNASTSLPHNFHTHLVFFRIVERDGAPAGPSEAGWKDTIQVFPGETVRLRLTFDHHRGDYLYHCHMIDHSAMGMMATLRVV